MVHALLLCLFGRGHLRQDPPSLAVSLLCFGFIISIYLQITRIYVCDMCVHVCVCYLVCRIGISAIKVVTVVGLLLKPSFNTIPGTSWITNKYLNWLALYRLFFHHRPRPPSATSTLAVPVFMYPQYLCFTTIHNISVQEVVKPSSADSLV